MVKQNNMLERFKLVEVNFEDHNKAYWEMEKLRKEKLKAQEKCGYCKLEALKLKSLLKIYTHAKTCKKYSKVYSERPNA
jgi:hypothetical protein